MAYSPCSSSNVSRGVLLLMILAGVPVACGEACLQMDGAGNDAVALSLLQSSVAMNSAWKFPTEDSLTDAHRLWSQMTRDSSTDVDMKQPSSELLDTQRLLGQGEVLTGDHNLCIASPESGELHLAPEFILLGAEKAATTSFATMFKTHSGIVLPKIFQGEPRSKRKEVHIFDEEDRFLNGKDFWLSRYPPCSRNKRLVSTDFTPNYLRVESVPAHMKSYYKESSPFIKFGIILRDPLARMHSAFHFRQDMLQRGDDAEWLKCSGEKGTTFKQYVVGVLAGSDPCGLLREYGDYSSQLQRFFEEFSPSQFTIFPYQDIVSPTKGPAQVARLWRRLGLQVAQLPKGEHRNPSHHASLEDDLDADVLLSIKALITKTMDADAVARVLTETKEKPVLAGYSGDGDVDSVAEWLRDNW